MMAALSILLLLPSLFEARHAAVGNLYRNPRQLLERKKHNSIKLATQSCNDPVGNLHLVPGITSHSDTTIVASDHLGKQLIDSAKAIFGENIVYTVSKYTTKSLLYFLPLLIMMRYESIQALDDLQLSLDIVIVIRHFQSPIESTMALVIELLFFNAIFFYLKSKLYFPKMVVTIAMALTMTTALIIMGIFVIGMLINFAKFCMGYTSKDVFCERMEKRAKVYLACFCVALFEIIAAAIYENVENISTSKSPEKVHQLIRFLHLSFTILMAKVVVPFLSAKL